MSYIIIQAINGSQCIHLYSLNGKLLHEKEVAKPINALVVVDKYLITGNDVGYLTFRELSRYGRPFPH